jgi:CheY-like chemotaxis protein
MLGVIHQGVAFPLVWTMLDKKGNSNHNERSTLMEEFREIFPDVAADVDFYTQHQDQIRVVTMDLMMPEMGGKQPLIP